MRASVKGKRVGSREWIRGNQKEWPSLYVEICCGLSRSVVLSKYFLHCLQSLQFPMMAILTSRSRSHMLLIVYLCLCVIQSGCCDDEVFIDIHITVDEPILSQTIAINAWAYGTIPGAASQCDISKV